MASLVVGWTASAWPIEISPLNPAGPAVQFWGWDIKAYAASLDSPGEAQLAYGDCPANIVRFPVFAQSISESGNVDGSAYTTQLQALSEILKVNPNVQIFASLKLLGADTFPSWVNSTDHTGKIFGNTVYRPDPVKYANLLTYFVQYMADQGYTISYLGPGNETGQALGPDRFGQTVQNLEGNLAAQSLPLPTIVGPDSFSLTTDGSWDHASVFLENATARDSIDIVGSHFYVDDESATNWRTLRSLSGGKPMWHTEVHIDTGAGGDLQQVYRDSVALAFKSNRNGVTGFVHWGPGTSTTNITAAIRRELISTMLGSRPSNMSNDYSIGDPNGTPLYQGYYNEADGKLYLWVANPGTWLPNTPVEVNGLAFNGPITGTWWQGDSETITATNTGSQSAAIAPDGRSFTSTFKSNAVTVLTIPVAPISSTFTWDADLGMFAAQDGSGVWTAGGSNWWTGVQSAWSHGAAVVFGAAGGTYPHAVTLGSDITVGNVTFAGQNYTIAGDRAKQYALALTGTPTITASTDAVIVAPLTGSGFTKSGAGTLTLGGANIYSGDTIIAAGTIKLAHAGADVPIVNSGFELPAFGPGGWSYLSNDGVPGGWSFNSGIGHNGSPWVTAAPEGVQAGFLQQSSAYAWQDITVAEPGTYTITFQAANRPNYPANGIILQVDGTEVGRWPYTDFNTGAAFISKSATVTLAAGTHTLNFAAWNGAGGDVATAIDDVRVMSSGDGLLPSATRLFLASGALFDLNGHNQTVASLNDHAGAGGKVTNSYPDGATLTVNPGTGVTAVFSGAIEDGIGTTGLTKTGAGTQALAGANSYSGDTTVSAGTLLVNGSLDADGAVTVGPDGKLGGSGAVGGPVTINGILAPGASIESLTTGILTFHSGSAFEYELNTSVLNGDLTVVNGDLDLHGTVTLDLIESPAGWLSPGSKLTLINYSGTWNNGTFDGYADDSIFTLGANQWQIDYNDAAGGSNFSGEQTLARFVTLTVASDTAAIPEPSTFVLLGSGIIGLIGCLWHRRRRWWRPHTRKRSITSHGLRSPSPNLHISRCRL